MGREARPPTASGGHRIGSVDPGFCAQIRLGPSDYEPGTYVGACPDCGRTLRIDTVANVGHHPPPFCVWFACLLSLVALDDLPKLDDLAKLDE